MAGSSCGAVCSSTCNRMVFAREKSVSQLAFYNAYRIGHMSEIMMKTVSS